MGRKLIAFDNSALQRLWDDPDQRTIMIEAAAVREILMRIEAHEHSFLLTWPLVKEIQMAPKGDFTLRALGVLPEHLRYAPATDEVAEKALKLHRLGLAAFDALHVACAILGGADVLFTTDYDILKFGNRSRVALGSLRVANPADFREVL